MKYNMFITLVFSLFFRSFTIYLKIISETVVCVFFSWHMYTYISCIVFTFFLFSAIYRYLYSSVIIANHDSHSKYTGCLLGGAAQHTVVQKLKKSSKTFNFSYAKKIQHFWTCLNFWYKMQVFWIFEVFEEFFNFWPNLQYNVVLPPSNNLSGYLEPTSCLDKNLGST